MNIIYYKKNSGITMIALIITITILLIIAGISISALSGNNSLIKNAEDAKEEADIYQEKDILEQTVTIVSSNNRYGKLDISELKERLKEYDDIQNKEDVEDGLRVTFKSGRSYIVDSNGFVEEEKP